MDHTNDPALRSWLPMPADTHFPIQNLPFGVFRRPDQAGRHIGVAIGDMVLDLRVSEAMALLVGLPVQVLAALRSETLNDFLALGRSAWTATRTAVSQLLRSDEASLRDDSSMRDLVLLPQSAVAMVMPVRIGDYTDFYSSREHATNVGTMLRGADNALQPNWLHLPVAYHGRASSIVLSGTDLHRPCGQARADDTAAPTFGPSRNLDFELEMGYLVGPGNELGHPISVAEARDQIFGLVLVNDWSARDIQKWEYVPLGPFLSKNFGTSISPWIVTLDALEPFRVAGPAQDPTPLPYLQTSGPQAFDIQLEVYLQTAKMDHPQRIAASNARHLYWSIAQQLAHHTINGCNMLPGDLVASGTISGPTPDSCGSMLELAWKGTRPLQLPGGETRSFLQDNDRVTITAWCQGSGYRVGFGEVTGRILPALTM
jgi:fumarylacetoacetase